MATYNPLLIQRQKLARQQAELERQIAQQQAQAKAAALLRIRELMHSFAISGAELEPPRRRGPKPGTRRAGKAPAGAVKRKVGRPRKNSGG
ncbi:MAG: hypothetical protein RLZZ584_1952 [Pseudomonadota bacterium]|jgi:DNA-binding protein H-NS